VPSTDAMRRAVLESKAALEALGHTLIEISPPDSYDSCWATWGIWAANFTDRS
jgi:Asp-tRNA(Asn)/Glu-tRNA(Gln) amidotransferase A subunit family amidase